MIEDLFPDLAPASPPARRSRRAAAVRVRLEVELDAAASPPDWLDAALRAMSPRRSPSLPRPGEPDTVGAFVAEHLAPRRGSSVTLEKAWGAYRRLCDHRKWLPLSRNRFAARTVRKVHARLGITPSHDLREAGKVRRGFRHMALLKAPRKAASLGEVGDAKRNTRASPTRAGC